MRINTIDADTLSSKPLTMADAALKHLAGSSSQRRTGYAPLQRLEWQEAE